MPLKQIRELNIFEIRITALVNAKDIESAITKLADNMQRAVQNNAVDHDCKFFADFIELPSISKRH